MLLIDLRPRAKKKNTFTELVEMSVTAYADIFNTSHKQNSFL